MAIGFRGSNVGGTNPTTTTNVAIHSGTQTGDLLLLAFTSRDHTSGNNAPTVADNDSGGNSWQIVSNTADRKAWLYWKRATANSAAKTITISGALGSLSAVASCFTGASSETSPFGNLAFETNASANETHAGITPNRADAMVFFAVFNYGNDNAVTSVSQATGGAMTQSGEHLSTGGSDCGTAVWYKVQSGGPSATGDITWSQFNGTTYSLVGALFAEVYGSLSKTESADTLSATGTLPIIAAFSKTDSADTSSATGQLLIVANFAKTEAGDTIAATATIADRSATATANLTEAADTASATALLLIRADCSKQEAADTVSAAATLAIAAAASITEAGDAISSSAQLAIVANAAATEAGDTLSATGLNGAGPAEELPTVADDGLPPHLLRRVRLRSAGYVHLSFVPRSTVRVKVDQSAELIALIASL